MECLAPHSCSVEKGLKWTWKANSIGELNSLLNFSFLPLLFKQKVGDSCGGNVLKRKRMLKHKDHDF